MKILLIAPPIMDHVGGQIVPIAMDAHRECPPYGVYLLAEVLRAAGHEVCLCDLIALGTNKLGDTQDLIAQFGLIGISATSLSWPTAVDVIQQVRATSEDVPIVLGGIHPTMFAGYLLRSFAVNYVIRGEAEQALPALAAALERKADLRDVPNLSLMVDGHLVHTPLAPKLSGEELASFPVPDFSQLPMRVYHGLSIESSRGCAFDCSFCSTSYRRAWRKMPPVSFVDRLQRILAHTGRTQLGTVHIIDDEFSTDPRRAIAIAQEIARRGLRPELVYDSRANDLLYDGFVQAIAPFTCQFLVGAECGYDLGLERVGKGTTCAKLEASARVLAEHGIADRADYSFILGLPWETRAEVEQTVGFATRLHARYGVRVLLQWYCEIPGSRNWDEDRRAGLVTEAMYNEYGFFRNVFLFRTAVRLSPEEIYKVDDLVRALLSVVTSQHPQARMVEYGSPEALQQYFPRWLSKLPDNGLSSLRQVAQAGHHGRVQDMTGVIEPRRPVPPVGIPLRHFKGLGND